MKPFDPKWDDLREKHQRKRVRMMMNGMKAWINREYLSRTIGVSKDAITKDDINVAKLIRGLEDVV